MEEKLIFILVAALFTCFISGIFGMAGGLLLKIILVNMLSAGDAIGMHAFIQVQSNGSRSLISLRHILWSKIFNFIMGLMIVAIFISAFDFQPNRQLILILSGGIPLIVSLFRWHQAKWFPRFETRLGGLIAGLVLGLISLLGGVGGPLLDAFFRGDYWQKEKTVANKAITQVISHLARLYFYGDVVYQPGSDLYYAGLLFVIVLGNWAGQIVLRSLSEKKFRRWTETIVMVLSIAALLQI